MARVVMQAVVSVDGFIAYPDDTVGPLFDWYGNGDCEVSPGASGWKFQVSQASADYVRPFWDAVKVTVIGRHLFDTTDGWDGVPAAGDELVVVTHRPLPPAWLADHPDAPFHTAGSVEAGITLAQQLAGDGLVCVTAGDLGGQAFSAGLVDEIAMDVAPVVFGEGVRFFGGYAVLAIALPLAYTPNLLDGLGGQVKASEVPSSWSSASRLTGQATVLFLPWHGYFPTPFTDGRAIANPAAFYFEGDVLTSQNPGPGYAFTAQDPEHDFLDKLLGPPVDRQRLRLRLADLGVSFVALAKVADWQDFANVADAPGIRLVYSSPSLDLFAVSPTAEEIRNKRRVRSVDLVDYLVLPGRPGVVPLPVPYSQGWTLDGRPAVRLADGQAGVLSPAGGGAVHYGPSSGILASEIGSIVAALAVAGGMFLERRRRALARSAPDP